MNVTKDEIIMLLKMYENVHPIFHEMEEWLMNLKDPSKELLQEIMKDLYWYIDQVESYTKQEQFELLQQHLTTIKKLQTQEQEQHQKDLQDAENLLTIL